MLNEKDAIRIEERIEYKYKRKFYTFKCSTSTCSNTITLRKSRLNYHRGSCMSCIKRDLTKPFLSTYNHLKYSARKRFPEKEFSLTYDELLFLTQIGVCHYCGSNSITWNAHRNKNNTGTVSNLDRKDNSKGYTFSNVVVCCKVCNFMKRDWLSYDEFRIVALLLKRWREGSSDDKQELESVLISWNLNVSVCPSESSIK